MTNNEKKTLLSPEQKKVLVRQAVTVGALALGVAAVGFVAYRFGTVSGAAALERAAEELINPEIVKAGAEAIVQSAA